MPTITVDLNDLKSLLKRNISDDELKEVLSLNKLEVESYDNELRLEVTPERIDLLSAEGIARQLRAWLEIETGLSRYPVSDSGIKLKTENVTLRPYIVAGVVRDVKFNNTSLKSIIQLQEMLDLTIGKDRDKVAIGMHDIDSVNPPFLYKDIAPKAVSFVPLGYSRDMTMSEVVKKHPKGIKYAHLLSGSKWPIILDSNGDVLSFPPIINGELTKVTMDTKNVFFDITGKDFKMINYALNVLVTALAERGGKIESVSISGSVNCTTPDLKPREIRVETDYINTLLGLSLTNEQIKELLERMNHGVFLSDSDLKVTVQPYRTDILHPVDIIEDIAIAYGYNDFSSVIPELPTVGEPDRMEEFSNILRELMIGLGFQEVLNFMLTSKEKHFRRMNLKEEAVVEIKNPVSAEYNIMRKYILPNLLEDLANNKHVKQPQMIFEIGECVLLNEKIDVQTKNVRKLSCVSSHSKANFSEVLSVIMAIKDNLGINLILKEKNHPSFIDGRCGGIYLKNKLIGYFGEIHPKVLENWEVENPVVGFEVNIEEIFKELNR